ncbi:MAG: metallophosphoesterase [Bacteroidales bacterium]
MPAQWIIPDTHGYVKTLRALIEEQIRPSKLDELYLLGDYIDRGPDSKGLIDYLIKLQNDGYRLRLLKGNHEDWCIQSYEEEFRLKTKYLFFREKNRKKEEWMKFGGKETLKSFKVKDLRYFPKEYIDWMRKLELYIELENYILVHAGFNFEIDNIFDDQEAMMWVREFTIKPEKIGHRKVIHGHVPVSHEFIDFCITRGTYPFIALDNGVYVKKKGFGNLTAFEINRQILLAQPSLDD